MNESHLKPAGLPRMIYSNQFRLLAQEGHLSANALLSGFESIAKSDCDKPGTIYSALFNLTIGLERMMKIAFVLNYMVENELSTPPNGSLKRFGHSLTKIYDYLSETGKSRGILDGWYAKSDLHYDLLCLLSEFASVSRYHNLDQIEQGHVSVDPLIAWFEIHMKIARKSLPYQKRVAVSEQAVAFCEKNHIYNYGVGMSGKYESMVDIIIQKEKAKLSRSHCVWTVLEIIKPLYHLITQLCTDAHAVEIGKGLQQPLVPHLEEFFPFALTTKGEALRRKNWSSLFNLAGRY